MVIASGPTTVALQLVSADRPGGWIDNMVDTLAILDKKPFVITGSRNRGIGKWQPQGNAIGFAWMLNADYPWSALAVTNDTAVTARTDHGPRLSHTGR